MILRKEDKHMKPEIMVLGKAVDVIENQSKASAGSDALPPTDTNPAYDLDE